MGQGTNEAVRARRVRDDRRLSGGVKAAARAERAASAAQDIRAAWAELQAAQALDDAVIAGRVTGRLGGMVAELRAAGVSVARIADLVGAPAALVRGWLRAAGGGR